MTNYYQDQEPADCEWCGKRLPTIRHWRTLFCGKACNNAFFNKLTTEARAEERAKLTCEDCGGPIIGAKRKSRRFCSSRCSTRALRQNQRLRCEAAG